MDRALKNELNECIQELRSIYYALQEASYEVEHSISGMNVSHYCRVLENCADKYKNAANQLKKIK